MADEERLDTQRRSTEHGEGGQPLKIRGPWTFVEDGGSRTSSTGPRHGSNFKEESPMATPRNEQRTVDTEKQIRRALMDRQERRERRHQLRYQTGLRHNVPLRVQYRERKRGA